MNDAEHKKLPCFKAYDIRGRVPEELDEKPAFPTGHAYGVHLASGSVAIGYDRVAIPTLAAGFIKAGIDVIGIDFDSEIKNISRFAWERA